jgi:N utilization substance protein A
MRGVRIQNVVNELNGEKIDVVQWDENPARFVANSLSPAQVLSVDVHDGERRAIVTVPDMQLSLAIGKEGQNARLAAKLTGWRVDIKKESDAKSTVPEEPEAEEVEDEIESVSGHAAGDDLDEVSMEELLNHVPVDVGMEE